MTQHQDCIVAFASTHREAWKRLNTDWLIDGGFALEAKDHLTLDDPDGQILSKGGHIFFAERDGVPVGCCGLIAMADGGYEVTKMTVRPEARGGGLALRLVGGVHGLYLFELALAMASFGAIYLLRSVALFLFFAFPPTPLSVVLFGAAMGTLWLGVIPLVNGLVVQIFGLRFLSTLTGIAFLSHQAGSFLGAWGGGYLFDLMGSYDLAWKIGVLIGLIAGTMQLLMNDRPTDRVLAAQASAA